MENPMTARPLESCALAVVAPERLRDRKGGDPSEWPEDLRVREFPAENRS